MKTWVIGIVVFLMWSAGSTYWYVCKVKGLCWESGAAVTAPVEGIAADSSQQLAAVDSAADAAEAIDNGATAANVEEASEAAAKGDAPTKGTTPAALPADLQKPHTVLFAFAGPTPENPDAFARYLDGVAAQLKSHPKRRVLLRGYTDDTAARENNIKLSQRRCDVVANLLHDRGVQDAQIVTEPLGEADPVATNDTPEGRRLNRRVVISIQE